MDKLFQFSIAILIVSILQLLIPPYDPEDLQDQSNIVKKIETEKIEEVDELVVSFQKPTFANSAALNRLSYILKTSPENIPLTKIMDTISKETAHLIDTDPLPASANTTLVTGLWRTQENSAFFKESLNKIQNSFLKHKLPKVIFTDPQTLSILRTKVVDTQTKFIILTQEKVRERFGNKFNKIEDIVQNPAWTQFFDNSNNPKTYDSVLNHLVRPYLLREAARSNPHYTPSFLWVDLEDNCFQDRVISATQGKLLNKMLSSFLVFHMILDKNDKSVLGYRQPSFDYYIDPDKDSDKKPKFYPEKKINLVRTTLFGGKIGHIELVTLIYDLMLRISVEQGLLGETEALMTLVAYRYPHLFRSLNAENVCADSTDPNLACPPNSYYSHPDLCKFVGVFFDA
eukprot:c11528_g1_i1.p1 GENE.c11528_g1_i1~~c11528_g1_i1.p1  ORF type:complete len:400 (+),score=160.17 c11528_g1_i1:63-1262(+)